MKRWALLTIFLYAVCITVLGALILSLNGEGSMELIKGFIQFFVPVLVIIQSALLFVPVDIANNRPVKQRNILLSAVFGAVPMGALILAYIVAVVMIIFVEDVHYKYIYNWYILFVPFVSWIIWGRLFYKYFLSSGPSSVMTKICNWLLKGSILALLVAIPSHIISRHRNECCAPPVTLLGIATGLSISLMAFGPGIFFLFVKRIKQKKRE